MIVAGVFGVKPLPRPELAKEPRADEAEEAAEETAPVEEVDPADSEEVRAWLDANSADILTCTDSERTAVLVRLDADGAAAVSLRGKMSGGAEEQCIRAGLGEKAFEVQSAEVLHVVKATEPSE